MQLKLKKNRQLLTLAGFLILITSLFACHSVQTFPVKGSGNPYQEDFLFLAGTIEEKHPGIPAYPLQIMPPDEFTALVNLTYERLEEVDNNSDFYYIMADFISHLNDGHSGIYFSPEVKKFLPVSVSWIGEKLYITRVFEKHFSDLLGREIVSIADIKTREVEKKINQYLHSDKGNIHHLRKELFGSNFFLMCYDTYRFFGMIEEDTISVAIKTVQGIRTVKLPFVGVESLPEGLPFSMARNRITETVFKNSHKILEDISTLYFQLGTGEVEKEYIRELFQIIRDKRLENLVLDLRNSGGGYGGETAIEFFKYLIRNSGDYYRYNGWRREGKENILVTDDGKMFMEAVSEELHFPGNLYLFINGTTFSSSSTLTLFARDNHLGTIMGEPCGNNYLRFGDKETITLPNTKIKAFYSTAIWGSAGEEQSAGKAIEPDILIPQTIESYINGGDSVWDYYLEIIS